MPKELGEKMKLLKGKVIEHIDLLRSTEPCDTDTVLIHFHDGFMLKVDCPLGHDLDEMNVDVSDGEAWLG